MKRLFTAIMGLCLIVLPAAAQKKELREGNREFSRKEYSKADISYRKALLKDTASVAAHYNLANNLYRQNNLQEAAKQLDAVKESAGAESFAPDYFFNRGDVAIASEDWQTAVDSFKECLRRNPSDLDAKKNYVYARNKLIEQQSKDQNEKENQDGEDKQDSKDQQDRQENNDRKQEPQEPSSKEQEEQPGQQQKQELSPQQAAQLLQAMQEKERKTQEKVDQEKAQAVKSRQKEKNW